MEPMLLDIDLSKKSYQVSPIPADVLRKYIGGRGLGSYLLCKSVPAKADPLGPENHLIFTAGPASGTGLYFSSKTNVNTKSPLSGIYLFTVSSGIFAHQMRKAGFWAINISGIADSPTYIVVNNQEVKFRDAASLWGLLRVCAGTSSHRRCGSAAGSWWHDRTTPEAWLSLRRGCCDRVPPKYGVRGARTRM